MGTKNNPGRFDCYGAADPDEPMFILLGRDRHAPLLVDLWAHARHLEGEDAAKVAEARHCADAMRAWAARLGKKPIVADAQALIDAIRLREAIDRIAMERGLDAAELRTWLLQGGGLQHLTRLIGRP